MSDPFDPSPARRGFDLLVALHPHLDVVKVEWGDPDQEEVWGDDAVWTPWVLVHLGQRGEQQSSIQRERWAIWPFAIWKLTGAVHSIDTNGAVSDDPLIEPEPDDDRDGARMWDRGAIAGLGVAMKALVNRAGGRVTVTGEELEEAATRRAKVSYDEQAMTVELVAGRPPDVPRWAADA
jgi:hypothetical protein